MPEPSDSDAHTWGRRFTTVRYDTRKSLEVR